MPALTQIARTLCVSLSQAQKFCSEVQRNCKDGKPSIKVIANCLKQHPDVEATPTEIARVIQFEHSQASRQKAKLSKVQSPKRRGQQRVNAPLLNKKHGALSRIAQRLNITEPEAHELCLEVQKHFQGAGVIPHFSVIADCIEKQVNLGQSSNEIAQAVRKVWNPALELKKRFAERRRKPSLEPKKRFARRRRKLGRVPKIRGDTTPKKVRLDKSRIPARDLEKCRHGVPKIQPCALCLGKTEFKRLTGIDT